MEDKLAKIIKLILFCREISKIQISLLRYYKVQTPKISTEPFISTLLFNMKILD